MALVRRAMTTLFSAWRSSSALVVRAGVQFLSRILRGLRRGCALLQSPPSTDDAAGDRLGPDPVRVVVMIKELQNM